MENVVGSGLVGPKMTLHRPNSGLGERGSCTSIVEVWLRYESILRFNSNGKRKNLVVSIKSIACYQLTIPLSSQKISVDAKIWMTPFFKSIYARP